MIHVQQTIHTNNTEKYSLALPNSWFFVKAAIYCYTRWLLTFIDEFQIGEAWLQSDVLLGTLVFHLQQHDALSKKKQKTVEIMLKF